MNRITMLRHVRLNRQGYDSQGRYFGRGLPLYRFEYQDASGKYFNGELRAVGRDDAKARVLAMRNGFFYDYRKKD